MSQAANLVAKGETVHSFRSIPRDLAIVVRNPIQPSAGVRPPFDAIAKPTPLQQRALDLLGDRLYP